MSWKPFLVGICSAGLAICGIALNPTPAVGAEKLGAREMAGIGERTRITRHTGETEKTPSRQARYEPENEERVYSVPSGYVNGWIYLRPVREKAIENERLSSVREGKRRIYEGWSRLGGRTRGFTGQFSYLGLLVECRHRTRLPFPK